MDSLSTYLDNTLTGPLNMLEDQYENIDIKWNIGPSKTIWKDIIHFAVENRDSKETAYRDIDVIELPGTNLIDTIENLIISVGGIKKC